MIPAEFVVVDELPLNANGKIDRQRAVTLTRSQRPEAGERRTPAGKLEQSICRVFKEVLECESICPDDDFFDRGGHSLLAMRAVILLRQAVWPDLTMRSIFDAPSAARLAEVIQKGIDRSSAVVAAEAGREVGAL